MKTIAVVSIDHIHNAGDEIIGDIAQYLTESIADDITVKRVGFSPPFADLIKRGYVRDSFAAMLMLAAVKALKGGNVQYKLKNRANRIRYGAYYKDALEGTDAVICAVGMLNYSTQNFSLYGILCRAAQAAGIPVMFCGPSVEKADKGDWRYRQLCRALHNPAVKMVTTRDGEAGIGRLRESIRRGIDMEGVGDLALWIPEYYPAKRRRGSVIGIGLVRGDIYQDYMPESGIDEAKLMNIYRDIVFELEKRGHEWVFFCNGMKQDYDFGRRLIRKLRLPADRLLPAPGSAGGLIREIAGFRAVIGARFHACMVSFAVGVPFIGMAWDSKFTGLGKMMGIEEQFVGAGDLNGPYMVSLLERVSEKDGTNRRRESYKMKTRDTLRFFVNHYVRGVNEG